MNSEAETIKTHRAKTKSSTREILGASAENGNVPGKWAEYYKSLVTLRGFFLEKRHALSESTKEEVPNFSEHMADAATDSYERDCALAMLSSDQNALYEIDQALDRIVGGTYGICELSGKPIEAARLKVIPWTRFTAKAQAELEAEGLAGRAHLGERRKYSESAETEDPTEEDAEEALTAAGERESV